MTDRGTGEGDPFRLWLEASRSVFATAPMSDPLRERCDALFGAWSRFAETYAEAGVRAAGTDRATGSGSAQPGTAGGPFDPFAWMDAAGAGGFGDLWRWFGDHRGGWQAEHEALMGSREWAAYALALGRYQAALAEGWLAAFRRFAQDLARDHPEGETPPWETIRACWQEAADRELAEAMRSEAFLAAQRDLVRARLDCAALIRRRLEGLSEAFGLPTRSEVDALAERVQVLSREVRALEAAEKPQTGQRQKAKGRTGKGRAGKGRTGKGQ